MSETTNPTCILHEQRLLGIEAALEEHRRQLAEHNDIYMRFLEKLSTMNENIVNLTKVETENSERIRELTNIIEKHIEITAAATDEISKKQEKQDKKFSKLQLDKLDKEDYKQDMASLKKLEKNYDHYLTKESVKEEICAEEKGNRREKIKLVIGAIIGFLSAVALIFAKWILGKFGINV